LASARRVCVVGVSGNGKTTLSKQLADRLGVRYVELDAIVHQAGWEEISDEGLREAVEGIFREAEGWVMDGSYGAKLGTLIYDHADTIVWLDQPLPLVLRRLVTRAVRDIVTKRDLFNGNRQTWRYAFFIKDSLVGYAIKQHYRRRRVWPGRWGATNDAKVVRLRSRRAVRDWLASQ
jgi:adenylate kinase family enzyme